MKIRREAKIGLYALLMLIALYWGINFLKGKDIFNRTRTYFATYEQVSGIQSSSPIMIRGYKVGVVSDIIYHPEISDKIVLEFSINSRYRIPENSQARIFSDGLMGGKAVEIILGNSDRFLQNRDTLHSSMDKDILEVAGSELEFLKQKVTQVADNLTKTLATLNEILTQNSDNINGSLTNLTQLSESLNRLVTSEHENLRGIIANINTFTQTLNRNAGNMDKIMGDLGTISGKLAETDITAMGDNLTASLDKLNLILNRIESGDGSLGRLINDKELYDSLTAATGNLAQLLEDLKANPGRYVNVTVFGGRNR